MGKSLLGLALLLALSVTLFASEYPGAEISNGVISAKLHLPDVEHGSYHGTRFDWSGIVYSLQYKGHEYFGKWYERHDPKIHDAITGPVEEFLSNDAGLGYADAPAGGTFVRIGVGAVRKPEEKGYQRFQTYDIADPGKWNIETKPDHIVFTQELAPANGFGYIYSKTVRLPKGNPELVLEHTLRNTGTQAIDTLVYDHNFFVIDNEVVGPDVVIRFPFDPHATADLKGLAELRGRDLVYMRDLRKGESVFTEIQGFGGSAHDYDFRIENRKSGAGVRIMGDTPLSKIVFWSIRTTACPEPYIHLHAEPGREVKWRITYRFYVPPDSEQ